jgi:hypothetical protein
VWAYAIPLWTLYALVLLFHLLQLAFDGGWAIAWFFYLCLAVAMTAARINIRELFGIEGNPVEDFFACMLLMPCAALQMEITVGDIYQV